MPLDEEAASGEVRKRAFWFFASPSLAMAISLSTSLTQVCLIKRNQSSMSILGNTDGSEGKEGGDPFPWFQALSFSMLLPSCYKEKFSSFEAQAQLCLLQQGRVFYTLASCSLRHSRGASTLLLFMSGQALPCVAPQLPLGFQVAVSHCNFLLLFKLTLTPLKSSRMSPLAAVNHGDTSRISYNPPLSFFPQDRRLFNSRYFPLLASLEVCPSNPISSRTSFLTPLKAAYK